MYLIQKKDRLFSSKKKWKGIIKPLIFIRIKFEEIYRGYFFFSSLDIFGKGGHWKVATRQEYNFKSALFSLSCESYQKNSCHTIALFHLLHNSCLSRWSSSLLCNKCFDKDVSSVRFIHHPVILQLWRDHFVLNICRGNNEEI